jgi:hypothetical protein
VADIFAANNKYRVRDRGRIGEGIGGGMRVEREVQGEIGER